MAKMRVHLPTGSITYNNVAEAADDLSRRGFNVGNVVRKEKVEVYTEETLAKLLPWEVVKTRSRGEEIQRHVRERLQEYRRKDTDASDDGNHLPE